MKKAVDFFVPHQIFTITIVIVFLFCRCSREYSYEGGSTAGTSAGSAVYTFNGAGGACLGSIIKGNYYVGALVSAGNSVDLQVNVTKVGTYEVSTNLVNGIQFSTKGTFTFTGLQVITLQAVGTPLSTGTFTYNPGAGLGCSFILQFSTAPPAIATFTFTGAPNSCTSARVNGDYVFGKTLSLANTVVISVNVTTVGAYTIKTDTLDGVNFSHSGAFTATGKQDVTLFATGSPDAPGNLTFTPRGSSLGCTFKVTVVNPEPLATYVLESGYGNPNPCTYNIAGTYIANNHLTASNSVSLRVFVTIPGNFTISTQNVNGILFSYTGTFTSTGSQYVTLTGSGTPVSAGTYSFYPEIVGPSPLGGASCSFVITIM